MSKEYFHSVTLNLEKCKGCTNCLKTCPTEAIRVRDGHAIITPERCIDCGECIRRCPYHAKTARTDSISIISNFQYKIALPAPALYGQFKSVDDTGLVIAGLMAIGFDEVFEVARGADIVSAALREELKKAGERPLISAACPAVVRLIQVKFPGLLPNVVDLMPPMEVAARIAKQEFCRKNNVKKSQVGCFFITPCPAKMTFVRNPLGVARSEVDGSISMLEIYGLLTGSMKHGAVSYEGEKASFAGIGWANSGGESAAVSCENSLAVDGIHNVSHVLEEIENDKFGDLQFFEGLACQGGCVGGALAFENAWVAKNRIRKLVEKMQREGKAPAPAPAIDLHATLPIGELPALKLDEDMGRAMQMMARIEEIAGDLKGLDCGSCGSPTCRALAEDIVRGEASEMDCIFNLRDKVKNLAQQMIDLSDMK